MRKRRSDFLENPPQATNGFGAVVPAFNPLTTGMFMQPQFEYGNTPIEYPAGLDQGGLLGPPLPPGLTMTTTAIQNIGPGEKELANKQHQRLVQNFGNSRMARAFFGSRIVGKLYDWFILDGFDSEQIEASYYEKNFARLLAVATFYYPEILASNSHGESTTPRHANRNVNAIAFSLKEVIESGFAANFIARNLQEFKDEAESRRHMYTKEDAKILKQSLSYFEGLSKFPDAAGNDLVTMYYRTSEVLRHFPIITISVIVNRDPAARLWRDVIASYNDEPVSETVARLKYFMEYNTATDPEIEAAFG